MSDFLDANGLTVQTLNDLLSSLTTDLQTIYGPDINLDSNSPDGQLINIFAQAGIDLREILVRINAGFDPDQAEGVVLDQRLSINGIKRNAGTFSTVDVSVTVSQALSLIGLDSQIDELNPSIDGLYTIQDSSGNQAYLVASVSEGGAGTYTLSFRAAAIGAVIFAANSLTTPVTIVAGVTSINNPSGNSYIGTNGESDAAVRVRRRKSLTLPSQGILDGMQGGILSLTGVTDAICYENATGTVDGFGVPAYTIWCIVEGGASADIAGVIYAKKPPGPVLKGGITYTLTRPNGLPFVAAWDVPTDVNLYVKFTCSLPGGIVDTAYLAGQIVANIKYTLMQDAVSDDFTVFVRSLNSKYRVTNMLLSTDNISFNEIVLQPNPNKKFILDVSRITIS